MRNTTQFDLDYAWLELGDISKVRIENPLLGWTDDERDHPGVTLIKLMSQPEYFPFTCKKILNLDLLPMQAMILYEMWHHAFPMLIGSRGLGKSFLLAVYALLKMIFVPKIKIVVVGAAFRQSKLIFEAMEWIWSEADVLRDIGGQGAGFRHEVDRWTFKLFGGTAMAIPIGDGSKIRGLRANVILSDEFSSIPPHIYETVIAGFGAVSQNPIDNVKLFARRRAMKEKGLWDKKQDDKFSRMIMGNQAIISGTADFDFGHFADYWKRYKKIVESGGNPNRLEDVFEDLIIPPNFNWRDFCVIRIPYELVPEGFMDDKQVIRAKATMHTGIYGCEYGACFIKDSAGFFKRSLIESCVASDIKPIDLPSGKTWFNALTSGDRHKQYVIAVDPASEQDNFSIVILELYPDHRRLVYCWTTSHKAFSEVLKAGLSKGEDDFYVYCSRKIRDLMKAFPCVRIGMDAQGGGVAVAEALHARKNLQSDEVPIWEVIDYDKPKDTDHHPGLHVLELVQFVRAEWTAEANHGLRHDMESKILLFPQFDPITIGLSMENDKRAIQEGDASRIYDSLENCVLEVEELKSELSTIVHTRTGTGVGGRDRWDTPEVKLPGGRKGRLRKDRYSALVIANMLARQMQVEQIQREYQFAGGFAKDLRGGSDAGQYYEGPEWFTSRAGGMGFAVNRNR